MKNFLRVVLAVAVAAVAAPALAQSFQVRASVQPSCRIITPNDLDFSLVGAYSMAADLDASTTFTFRCSKNTAYQIGIDAGSNPGAAAAYGTRAMANGGEFLGYELYRDAGRTQVWGNAAPDWLTGNSGAVAGVQTATVYGRIPLGQDVTPTAVGVFYTDATVTITINY